MNNSNSTSFDFSSWSGYANRDVYCWKASYSEPKTKTLRYVLVGIDPDTVKVAVKGKELYIKVDEEIRYSLWLEDWVNPDEIKVELKWGLLTIQLAQEEVEKPLEIKKNKQ